MSQDNCQTAWVQLDEDVTRYAIAYPNASLSIRFLNNLGSCGCLGVLDDIPHADIERLRSAMQMCHHTGDGIIHMKIHRYKGFIARIYEVKCFLVVKV